MITLKTLTLALLTGVLPTLIWLFFWLREDRKHPEPLPIIALAFVAGALSAIIILPVERFFITQVIPNAEHLEFLTLSFLEELGKYLAVLYIALRTKYLDEPVDYAIYLVTAGLGFAALENTLFLLSPFMAGEFSTALITGNLRFLGATLLHAVTGALIGLSLGLVYFKKPKVRAVALVGGFILAVSLHAIFNFLIMRGGQESILTANILLWVLTIFVLFIFERVKRMTPN